MAEVTEQIEEWLKEVKTSLIQSYKSAGLEASGNWEDEIETNYEIGNNKIAIKILGSSYTYFMEYGRGKNKDQSHEALRKFAGWMANKNDGLIFLWTKNKGINEQYAFPIAYSIGQKGYEGKPFLGNAINEASIESLLQGIGEGILDTFTSGIIKDFKNVDK